MKKILAILFVAALFLLASGTSIRKDLIGVWKIQSMEIRGVKLVHQQMAFPYIEFNEEGGFMVKVGSYGEKGKYTIRKNTVLLKFLIPKKPMQQLVITKLGKSEMDYTTTDTSGEVKVTCYRITVGLKKEND
jgi:hypothetical protein